MLLSVPGEAILVMIGIASGVCALTWIRGQRKPKVSLPAFIGVGLNGFFLLLLIIAMVIGMIDGMKGFNRLQAHPPAQTNTTGRTK
jgi:hypothetical protein